MRKHRVDYLIAIFAIVLMVLGLLVIFSVGPRVAQFENSQSGSNFSESYFFVHHAFAVVLAVIAMVIGYFLPYAKLEKISFKILGIGFALCALVWVLGKIGASGIVTCDEGACRSFHIPGLGVGMQPVEIVKVGVLFYVAWLVKARRAEGELDTRNFWIPVATIVGLTALLVAVGLKDFGSTVVIFFMVALMIFCGGASLKSMGIALAGIGVLALLLIVFSPHRVARLASFGDSYHVENSLISLGTGGFLGVGMGNSIQSTGYLPEALSDSIFSIIGEVMGFVGTIGVLLLFLGMLIKMMSVSRHTEQADRALFVIGVIAWIFAHVIINVGGMIGIIPVKGITLPFLSYGGTSMLFVAFVLGIVLQISSWTKREIVDENSSSRRGQWRPRNASRSRR